MDSGGNMAILKCKMCGGDLQTTDNTYGTCDSCGSTMVLPKASDESKTDLLININLSSISNDNDIVTPVYENTPKETKSDLDRLLENAQTCLDIGNFLKAETLYHDITDSYPRDHRGWWGLILSKTENLEKTVDSKVLKSIKKNLSYIKKLTSKDVFIQYETTIKKYIFNYSNNYANQEYQIVRNSLITVQQTKNKFENDLIQIIQKKNDDEEKYNKDLKVLNKQLDEEQKKCYIGKK